MKRENFFIYFAWIFFGIVALLSHYFLFQQTITVESNRTVSISKQLGAFYLVSENKPSASEIRGLETSDILKRIYSDGNHEIELIVAYIAHSSRKSAHAQEACLRGSGALVGSIEKIHLQHSPVLATSISIDISNRRSRVYYWYKIGPIYTSDYLRSSLKMFLGGLIGQPNHGAALVRLLIPEKKGEGENNSLAIAEEFTSKLLPELERCLP